jgi:hypothetical protein
VAVPEGIPWRLLCNAGPIRDVVGSERARDGTVKVGSRVHSSRSTSRDSRPIVGGVSEVWNECCRTRGLSCGCRCLGASRQLRGILIVNNSSAQVVGCNATGIYGRASCGSSEAIRELISTADQIVELVIRLIGLFILADVALA